MELPGFDGENNGELVIFDIIEITVVPYQQ